MKTSLLILFLPFVLFADKYLLPPSPALQYPWLTGPLLCPTGYVVPGGNSNYEPYIYVTANTGTYNSDWKVVEKDHIFWTNTFQPVLQFGLTSWMDFEILPTVMYNYVHHEASWALGDLPIILNFQLFKPDHPDDWVPAIKLRLQETFPIGKYRNLNPKKLGTDAGGEGSFQTLFGIAMGTLWHFKDIYFMTTRLYLAYTLPAATHLKGFNTYGGESDTNAHFFPPQNFLVDFAVELTLSRNWALACDFVGTWAGKPHFSGNPGTHLDGTTATLGIGAPAGSQGGSGSSAQYSLAPAIEYNWSSTIGIIGGGWFTFGGRNSNRFWSAVIAFNYYYQ